MSRYLLLLVLLLVSCSPCSADPYVFPDAAGDTWYYLYSGSYMEEHPLDMYSGNEYIRIKEQIDVDDYDSFFVYRDDLIYDVDFYFECGDDSFLVPITFLDVDGNYRYGYINCTTTQLVSFWWLSYNKYEVSLESDNETLLYMMNSFAGSACAELEFTRDRTVLSFDYRYGDNESLAAMPIQAVFFNISDFPYNSHVLVEVVDDTVRQSELNGISKYLYDVVLERIDSDGSLYFICLAIQSVWNYGSWFLMFCLTSMWFYILIVEVLALGWAVMSRTLGKAIERYVKMHIFCIMLPVNIIKYFFDIVVRLVRG